MAFSPNQTEAATQAPYIRYVLMDALRGFALLGILWINIQVFADEINSVFNVQIAIQPFLTDYLSSRFSDDIIEGTMRGLFSILFGASAIIFLSEVKLASQGLLIVDRYYRRALLLIAFGIIHAYVLLWPYDVLFVYGIISMLLFPIRKMAPRYLFLLGIIVLMMGDWQLPDDSSAANQSMEVTQTMDEDESVEIYLPASQMNSNSDAVIEANSLQASSRTAGLVLPSYANWFQGNIDTVIYQHAEKLYKDYIFDVGGMMIIGIALLKTGVLLGSRSQLFYFLMMLLGYGLGYLVRDPVVYTQVASMLNFKDSMDESLLGYNLGRLIMSLGHIGLIACLLNIKWFAFLIHMLSAVGRLTLTNYIMQTVLCLLVFYVFSGYLFAWFTFIKVLYILFAICSIQIVCSLLWLKYFKFGPLEWLWRQLIYGKGSNSA
ncbi:MAG: DUF418 domain-containing protein [Gammaproteobacteria bacterium]|nr:DUF418 domain-containing protein [Gammaproteobacteria bacterium]